MSEFLVLYSTDDRPLPERLRGMSHDELGGSIYSGARQYAHSWDRGQTAFYRRVPLFEEVSGKEARISFFHGYCVHRGRLVRNDSELGLAGTSEFRELVADARGVFCVVTLADNGDLLIGADYLSIYGIWYAEVDGLFVVSNNTHMIASVLRRARKPIGKNAEYTVLESAFTAGIGEETGYDRVFFLPFGKFIRLTAGPRRLIEVREVVDDPLTTYRARDAASALEELRSDIEENVRALDGARFQERVADLSGGFDSRTVLAALSHCGAAGTYVYSTTGGPANADEKAAYGIRRALGLRRGRLIRQPHQYQQDYVLSVCHAMSRSYGCRFSVADFGGGTYPSPGLLKLSGVCGELFRSSYFKNVKPGEDPVNLLLRMLRVRLGEIVRENVLEKYSQMIADFFRRQKEQGFTGLQAIDRFYAELRNGRYTGLEIRCRQNVRVECVPLYSRSALRAGFAVKDELRGKNLIGFSLISGWEPRLVQMPFAEVSWSPEVIGDRAGAEREGSGSVAPLTSGPPPIPEEEEAVRRVVQRSYEIERRGVQPTPEEAAWESLSRRQGRHWSWARLPFGLRMLREILSREGVADRISSAYRVDVVRALASKDPTEFPSQSAARQVFQLLGAALWLSDQERVDQIPDV